MSTEAPSIRQTTNSAGSMPEDDSVLQIVSFRLGKELYGVDVMHVQEIILFGQVTEIPNVPECVCGLINLRGHIIPIVDLRVQFGLTQRDRHDDSRIIVLNVGDKMSGIIVDAVEEVIREHEDQIQSAAGMTGIGNDYVRGLLKLEKKLLILLNVENILDTNEAPAETVA